MVLFMNHDNNECDNMIDMIYANVIHMIHMYVENSKLLIIQNSCSVTRYIAGYTWLVVQKRNIDKSENE